MPLKLSAKARHAAATSSPSFALEPGARVADIRQHFDTTRRDVLLPNGTTLVQPRLPSLLTRLGAMPPQLTPESEEDPGAEEFAAAASDAPDIMHVPGPELTSLNLHNRIKRGESVGAESKSLRDLDGREAATPSCACNRKRHKVVIVHFSAIQDVELEVCKCTTAAVQLMRLGAFGCAPLRPSLAVDLRVLEFARNLFLQISPNNTAITLTLEFGNALTWYTHLCDLMKYHYQGIIDKTREEVVGPEIPPPPAPAPPPPPSSPAPSPARGLYEGAKRTFHPHPAPPTQRVIGVCHPNSRCPRWTQTREGGIAGATQEPIPGTATAAAPKRHDPTAEADIFPCIDACFTQKKKNRRHGRRSMWTGVRGTSGKKERPRKRGVGVHMLDEDEDGYEHEDLLLPRSVLDGCEASFKAADEKREKASTDFFEDTALMALVCRHDRVLFLANMHSAGEKQFLCDCSRGDFIPAHPPRHRCGLLYDVACSAERSCVKWGFLDRFMGRIALLYHPRKRVGFGFTNGEGAERIWNSIRHLIAHLRICGYHNRLYTLDAQIIHHQEASLFRLGDWIRRRYHHCLQKRTDATKDLRESGKPVAFLREQWKLQVVAQTKPLPRRNKNLGQRAVNAVVLLRSSMKARQELCHELREKYLRAVEDGDEAAAMYEREFREAEEALAKAQANLRRKEAALGVIEHAELQELVKSEYMRLRMNARALKLRLRERLRARKFEMDVVERAYRRLMNDSKLHAHTESAVKRREPTITKIAAEYNKLCGQLAKLIKDGKAPAGSTAPLPIPSKGLWQLEVDDVIFLDVGLDDADDNDGEPPPWLCDEQVRVGIKGMLQLDRCDEEDARLWRETMALRVWFGEEWQLSSRSHRESRPTESAVDKYHLQLHQDKLVHLCATWDKHLPDFGPEKKATASPCRTEAHVAARGEDRHYGVDDDEDEEDEYDEGSGGEEEDFETLDAMERADIYRHDEQDNY
ncbi:hypothetical protein B0H14DRAFT_3438323 [Mycena olivaceomarginata]|nr:hypothetical protein B0H14DRAFT_3438323 [Mycena olivaceomarginata]